jgi:hypothetical protein
MPINFLDNTVIKGTLSASGGLVMQSTTLTSSNSTTNAFNTSPLTIVGAASGSIFESLQNIVAGVSASTDISLYNDASNYIDLGIASSRYNGNAYGPAFNTVGPGDGYLYTTNNNLAIGTAGVGNVNFFTNGTLSGANTRMTITSSGITVNGTVRANNSPDFLDLFDNTTRYFSGATITNNLSAPFIGTGDPWWVNLGSGPAPTIQSGGIKSTANGLWYLGSSVPSTSGRTTLGFIFQSDLNPTTTTNYNNIMNISFSPTPMMGTTIPDINPSGVVHINFVLGGIASIDYYGTGISLSGVNTAYDPGQGCYPWRATNNFTLAPGVKYAIILKVDGNYLTITIPGVTSLTFYEPSLSSKVGANKTYFWWEDGRADAYGRVGKLIRVWGGITPTPYDQDPAYGTFVGGNVPVLNSTGPYQLPGTIQSYKAAVATPTNVILADSLPNLSYGVIAAGNGVTTINAASAATGGNIFLEGALMANFGSTSIGGTQLGYGTFEINSNVTSPLSSATTGSSVSLVNITRLQTAQPGDRQMVEITGNLLTGTKSISATVFATGESVFTYGPVASAGNFVLRFNRKTHTNKSDVIRAEMYIGTTLVATNRTTFNNTNYYPYQINITQDTAGCVIIDDVRNTVQRVNYR